MAESDLNMVNSFVSHGTLTAGSQGNSEVNDEAASGRHELDESRRLTWLTGAHAASSPNCTSTDTQHVRALNFIV
ncbi:uncharacterized protein LOC142775845 isoform X2 [Rhipicephalus microplus]|uniref:uncharacterized protein LOC142775845 isoform X2 n=1 Tax=Rhipicephalus microplus TaxID=6941 RepID=UPI003F6BCCDB